MSAEAFLEQVWLADSEVRSGPRESLTTPLNLSIDTDDLKFENRDDGRSVATVALSLALHRQGAEAAFARITATFRLIYRMGPIVDLKQQRVFIQARALPDAWPVWRTWLHETLSQIGLAPTPLPAQMPPQIEVEGANVFDLAAQVQKDEEVPQRVTEAGLWKKLEQDLDATEIGEWEFIAPRSGWEQRRAAIYKLFLRPRRTRGRWWLFEKSISQVPSTYPDTSCGSARPFDIFRGSANLLEFVGVDGEPGEKPALRRGLKMVQRRLAAQKPVFSLS